MIKLSPKFLTKYLKIMGLIAGVSGVLDTVLYFMTGFMVPSIVLGATWFTTAILLVATGKLIEESEAK
ncbi:hypothetical protein DRN63_04410 [Nanoarchaeota archaeon]|nr:MAG: hypothetical protein DRN63_04410 [Nanoarchaeota archaeon]